jgi:hypothetical protein
MEEPSLWLFGGMLVPVTVNIQNEEDVKNKIVIPYLLELGFLKEELDYETNFHLKFGRSVIPIGARKSVDSANARLDILVTYQGKNICVFEVKADTVKISEDDIKQVVSYGSLVRPMVPFCIITNGKDSPILVDTISGDAFQKEDIERYAINGYKVSLPDKIYYDRIKYFIGYSKENLMRFCEEQVSLYMKPLKGSKDEQDKKYIKEIYESPNKLEESLNTFISQADSSSFVLVAKSGMGKTCWTCHIAESLLESGIPILFYRANDVKKGIFEAIKDDLNWTLSPQFNVEEGMKRFFEVFQNDTVFIVVDGLDEIKISLARDITEDFFRRIKSRNVKFISSCKTEVWPSLLMKDEIPLLISEETFNKGFTLYEMEDEQFYLMIEKYRQFYNFKGLFQDQVLKDCKRNFYLLRVMFDVASSESNGNLTYTSASFFQKYFRKIVNRFEVDEQESIESILHDIGKLIYENNSDYVDVQEVRNSLRLSPLDKLPSRLFDLNILDKQEGVHSDKIGFYFQRFRDYIIAFRILRWQHCSSNEFEEQQKNRVEINGVKLNVLEMYYTLANDEHKRILDRPIYDIAYEYVSFYEKLINTYFPDLKEEFHPKTKDEIGFVGYFDISKPAMIMHGFRSITISDPKVLLIPASGKDSLKDNNLDVLYGVETGMRMRFPSIFTEQINVAEEVIGYDIPTELQNIITKGKLNEEFSIPLMEEKLLAIGYSFYPEYIGVDSRVSGMMIKGFPLAKLKEGVLTKRALRILEDELIQNKIKSEKIKVSRQKSIVSYYYTFSEKERKILKEKAIQIGKGGIFYQSIIRYSIENFEVDILNTISILERKGVKEICDPLAVRRESLSKFNELYRGCQFDIEYAESFFCELLNRGLAEYRTLIETNFSALKEAFVIYMDTPLTFFISLEKSEHRHRTLGFTEEIGKPFDDGDYVYSVKVVHGNGVWNFRNEKIVEGRKYKIIRGTRGYFDEFLTPSLTFCSFKGKDYLLCIRSLTYSLIAEECNAMLNLLAEKYGVELKKRINFN